MNLLLPFTVILMSPVLSVVAAKTPAPQFPDAAAYAAVDKAIKSTLTAIRTDLLKLHKTGTFPQLSGIEKSEIRSSNISWKETSLHHAKDAAWVAGDFFKFGENGGRILVNLRSYDAKSDPRFGTGAMSAAPGPHFVVKTSPIPFGIEFTVDAPDTDQGKAFEKRVGTLISGHLKTLKKELGAEPVSWSALVDRDDPLNPAELHKEAFVVLEGTVTGRNAELYEEIGQPKTITLRVAKLVDEKKNHQGRLSAGDTITIDTWKLDPEVKLAVGGRIKAWLDLGFVQHAPDDLRPVYRPVARNAIKVTARP